MSQKRKMVEDPRRIERHQLKLGGCVGGGDPLFEGRRRQGLNGGQAVDGREEFGFHFS